MTAHLVSRRIFSVAAGAFAAGLGVGPRADAQNGSLPLTAARLGISNANAAIHQEVVFKASAKRVYDALTNARQFDKIVLLSGAMKSMSLKPAPAQIHPEPGGAFALFGGYITGRNIELTPYERIVQAWRAASWAPHIYSIARFELAAHPEGVKLSFDQTGFPNEAAMSLASGWQRHYWEPLAKLIA